MAVAKGSALVTFERAEPPRCESCGHVLRDPTGEPYRLNERHRWEYDDPVLGAVELRFGSPEEGSWVPVDSTLPEDAESVFDTFERRELIAREQAEAARNARCYLCGQGAPDSRTLCGQPVHQACYTRPVDSPRGGGEAGD